jgi:WD40-like Beta Propeller Repeat
MIARRSISMALVWLCAGAGGLSLWSAPALAQRMHAFSTSFGGAGTGDGQLSRPGALAVNEATGDVYVIDRGNDRVEIFSATGAYVGQFNGSAAPTGTFSWLTSGPGSVLREGSIAVDNSKNPLDPSKGDVYVTDEGHKVIDKFTASGQYIGQIVGQSPASRFDGVISLAVDSNGGLWVQIAIQGEFSGGVLTGDIYQFNDESVNEYVSQILPSFPLVSEGVSGILGTIGFAFESEGNFYIGKAQGGSSGGGFTVPAKFTKTGEILAQEVDEEETTGLGVDVSSDDVYVDHETNVAAYGPSGSFIERFGSAQMAASAGIAVDSTTGTVYTANATTQEIDAFTAFVVPDVTTGSVSHFGETAVTVGGVVDPDGLPVSACVFEYGTSESYGQSEACSTSPGSGSSPVAVSAELKGLERLRTYHFRLKVSNANGSNVGQDRTLLTPEPVGISEEGVSDVTSGSALFSALVNPEGSDTTFHFEYGTGLSYGESVPVPDGDLGTGTNSERAAVRAQDLLADTTYHVRIVASNALGTVYGPDESFTTQAGGGAFVLPDGREWELVSPPSKEGASIEPLGPGAIQASEDGSAITYLASGPILANPQGNGSPGAKAQVLSRRGADGWSSEDIITPHEAAEAGNPHEYRFFSADLSKSLAEPDDPTPLSPEVTEQTMYVRDDSNGGYVPLLTAGDVSPGARFGVYPWTVAMVGTPDLSHVLLESEARSAPLTSNAIGGSSNLYEWSGGRLQLVSILKSGPVGGAIPGGDEGGDHNLRGALSSDGSRVFFQVSGALYMRDTVTEQTVEVDAPAPGVSLPAAHLAKFQLASADGSKVFFLDQTRLTPESTLPPPSEEGGYPSPDLYECQIVEEAGKLKCDLTDLSVDRNTGEQAEVQREVLGASEDGSVVYFLATGKLAEGAEPGKDNLYVESQTGSTWSAPRLVAVLSVADGNDWDIQGESFSYMTSRVSPNGRYLAFMSDRSLTGYDNRDVNSGRPDEEVFVYDEATGHLVCASCNRTGARPEGLHEPGEGEADQPAPLVDRKNIWRGDWLAANLPEWTQVGSNADNGGAIYQSRYLSNEGRLFFDSADALVAQDTNGREDVYEYEPAGVGGASGCTVTRSTYVGGAGGCVSLISSGTSAEESAFLDASGKGPGGEEGEDVFFVTAARLTLQDVDTSFDLYDAHICSAAAPCVSVPVSPPPCASGDACKAAPSPQPAIFGAPSSATFSGAGNVAPSAAVGGSKPKSAAKKKSSHGKSKPKPKHKPKRKGKGKSKGKDAGVHKSLSARTRR